MKKVDLIYLVNKNPLKNKKEHVKYYYKKKTAYYEEWWWDINFKKHGIRSSQSSEIYTLKNYFLINVSR